VDLLLGDPAKALRKLAGAPHDLAELVAEDGWKPIAS